MKNQPRIHPNHRASNKRILKAIDMDKKRKRANYTLCERAIYMLKF